MNYLYFSSLIIFCITLGGTANAKRSAFSSRGYTKKTPYAGLGKKSSANGLIKAKGVSGHCKKTSRGYTFVNPYAKSK